MGEKKTFVLRIDPELYRELERLAAAEFRSVNGQIEYILHDTIRKKKGRPVTGGKDEKKNKREAGE